MAGFDDRQKGIQLRRPRLRASIAGRFRVRQNLLQRLPVNLVLTARSPFTDLTVQHPAADLGPFFHIRKHPCLLLTFGTELLETGKSDLISAGEHLGATFLIQIQYLEVRQESGICGKSFVGLIIDAECFVGP